MKKTLSKAFAALLCVALAVCMLALPAAAEETYAASVGETGYATVAEAVANANGETVKLLTDSDETVTVSGDLYLDLNGHTLAGLTITDGKLYGMDSATDDYVSANYGKIVSVSGDYAVQYKLESGKRYLAVSDEGLSFHRFYLGITHKSLQPSAQGVGYKALFAGDYVVKQQLAEAEAFGYTLQLGDYAPISRWKSQADFAAEKTLSLRVKNYDPAYGETELKANVQIKLANGEVISSAQQTMTLKGAVEEINSSVSSFSTAQIEALAAWIENADAMKSWAVANILQPAISYEINTGKDLVIYTEQTGALQSIAVKGTELVLENATLENGVLTIPAKSFLQETMPTGRVTLIVTTDTQEVQYTGDFTLVITSWANKVSGLAYMNNHMVETEDGYTGAFALGADIAIPDNANLNNFAAFKLATVFNGSFDGRNYTISNLTPKANTALIGTLGEKGIIKNVKLMDVEINANAAGITCAAKGTIENVYVQGSILGDAMTETSDLANFGCGLLAGQIYKTAKIENCIVEVAEIAEGLRLGTAYGKLRGGLDESIFVYCNAVNADGNTFMQGDVSGEETVWTKESFSWDYTNMNFASMDELWQDSVAAELAESLGFENPNTPKDMILEDAFDMNVEGSDLIVANTKLVGALQSVAIEGTELTLDATLVDGKLTVPAASFQQTTMPTGTLNLVVTTDSEQIKITGDFIWVINTEAELLQMKNHLTPRASAPKYFDGMLALGTDLMSDKGATDNLADGYVIFNKTYTAFANDEYFAGTFDGRYHVINKILANGATYGIFTNLSKDGIIKNLKVTNAFVKTNTAAVVGYRMQGTLQNVYIHGQIDSDGMNANSNLGSFGNGLVAAMIFDEARFENCIVELKTVVGSLRLATAYGKMHEAGTEADVFTNCFAVNAEDYTFMANGTWTKQSFTTGGTNANFASMDELWKNETAATIAVAFGFESPYSPKDMTLEGTFDMNVEGNDLVVTDTYLSGKLESVTVVDTDGNTRNLPATLVDGTLTIPAKSFMSKYQASGQLTLTVTTDIEQIAITGEFVWTVLDAATTLSGLTNIDSHLTNVDGTYYGHLALGADIDLGTINLANFTMGNTKSAAVFEGTFDGRNHTISGGAGRCLFYTVGKDGVVENLKMTGITVSTYSAPVTYICKGTLDSIYVQGSITADGMDASSNLANFGCGLLAGQYYNTAKVSNCIIDVISIADSLRLGSAFGKLRSGVSENIFANCYAIGAAGNTFAHYVDGSYVKADFTAGGSNANFATLEALITSDDVVAIVLASVFGLITE